MLGLVPTEVPHVENECAHGTPICIYLFIFKSRVGILVVVLSALYCSIPVLMFSYPFPPVTQCLSVACQRASVRLSTSVDPFTRPCDYFLITCGSDRPWTTTRGKQRDKGPPLNLQKQKGAEMRTEKNLDGNMRGEETLDRKTALMRYLQEALGTIV